MKKAAKQSMKKIPNNINSELVNNIQIPMGKFNLRLKSILWQIFLVIGIVLIPIDMYSQGMSFFSGPGIIAWLTHAAICTVLITGMVRGLFKYEINEFGVKCFNLKGGTWFIEWDNFENIETKKFLWIKYISIQPTDNHDRFSILYTMEHYELFKALCYKLTKGKHELISHL